MEPTNGLRPLNDLYQGGGCFFCDQNNPVGPRLRFFELGGPDQALVCHTVPAKLFAGRGRVLHGGIISGLLDEIMAWGAHHFADPQAVTASLQVDFLGPVYVEEPLELRCRVVRREGRRIYLEAEAINQQGEVRARAKSTCVLMDPEKFQAALGSEE